VTQTRDFLDRFRPAGAPGAAARAGVPADRARELAAEVDPVLALLDGVQAECERIIETARREADRITADAHAGAERIGREAGERARAARDKAAGEVLAQARAQARQAATDASEQARQVRRLVQRRLPGLVTSAVGLVRAGLAGQPGEAGEAGGPA